MVCVCVCVIHFPSSCCSLAICMEIAYFIEMSPSKKNAKCQEEKFRFWKVWQMRSVVSCSLWSKLHEGSIRHRGMMKVVHTWQMNDRLIDKLHRLTLCSTCHCAMCIRVDNMASVIFWRYYFEPIVQTPECAFLCFVHLYKKYTKGKGNYLSLKNTPYTSGSPFSWAGFPCCQNAQFSIPFHFLLSLAWDLDARARLYGRLLWMPCLCYCKTTNKNRTKCGSC